MCGMGHISGYHGPRLLACCSIVGNDIQVTGRHVCRDRGYTHPQGCDAAPAKPASGSWGPMRAMSIVKMILITLMMSTMSNDNDHVADHDYHTTMRLRKRSQTGSRTACIRGCDAKMEASWVYSRDITGVVFLRYLAVMFSGL